MSWYQKTDEEYSALPALDGQYLLDGTANVATIACKRCEIGDIQRLEDFENHPNIVYDDTMFWKWLTKGSKPEESQESVSLKKSLDGEEKVQEDFITAMDDLIPCEDDVSVSKPTKLFGIFKKGFAAARQFLNNNEEFEEAEVGTEEQGSVTSKCSIVEELIAVETQAEPTLNTIQEPTPEAKPLPIYVGKGKYLVKPVSVWRVDSLFSISSLDLNETTKKSFNLLESMPVADFDLLRQGRRPLMSEYEHGLMDGTDGGYGAGDMNTYPLEDWIKKHLLKEVSPILLPPSVANMSVEEGELISMVYFDLNTRGEQWYKVGIPDEAYLVRKDTVNAATDWKGLDRTNLDDGFVDEEPEVMDMNGRNDGVKRMTKEEIIQKFPEPIPRERVFSMLMYSEYAWKLADAYDEMAKYPSLHSSIAELFALLSESKEGPELFCDSCLLIAPILKGREAFRNVLSCARTSTAWTSLICDVTQRLRFQSDNVERIKGKYGLDTKCRVKCEEERCFDLDPADETNVKKMNSGFEEYDPSHNDCVYYEFDRILDWNQKLTDLNIAEKDCPLGELSACNLKKLSRFYRSMLLTTDGAILFAELMIQYVVHEKGWKTIGQLIRFVTAQPDGIERLIEMHRQIGDSGATGRRLLLRLYNAVKRYLPSGLKIITRLANQLIEVTPGRMLIEDLQVDGGRAHVIARHIRNDIRKNLNPFVKAMGRNISQIVIRLNGVAQCMLSVAEHAKAVLEGSGDAILAKHKDFDESLKIDKPFDGEEIFEGKCGPRSDWKSTATCCRNYKDLIEEQKKNADGLTDKPPVVLRSQQFQWSDTDSALSCEVELQRNDLNVADLWEPVDAREKVNIYKEPEEEPLHPCTGVKPPCRWNVHCKDQIKTNYNNFYLQSTDYEKFYMTFGFRPSGVNKRMDDIQVRLGGFGAYPVRSDTSLQWKEEQALRRRDAYKGMQSRSLDLPTIAGKWGRRVVEQEEDEEIASSDTEAKKNKYSCICTKHGSFQYGCLICSIARQLSDAESCDEVADIITDKCQKFPSTSVSKIPPFPEYEHLVVAANQMNLESTLPAQASIDSTSSMSGINTTTDQSSKSPTEIESTTQPTSCTELRSVEGLTDINHSLSEEVSSQNVTNTDESTADASPSNITESSSHLTNTSQETSFNNDTSSAAQSAPFPSAGNPRDVPRTPRPSAGCCVQGVFNKSKGSCPCSDGKPKPDELPLTKRNLAMYTKSAADENIPELDSGHRRCSCNPTIGGQLAQRSPLHWPITAKHLETPKDKEANSLSDSTVEKSSKPDLLSPEVPARDADLAHWANERRSESEFSRPDLDNKQDEYDYCLVCGGVVSVEPVQDRPFAYRYLVKHDEGERLEGANSLDSLTTLCDVGLDSKCGSSTEGLWKDSKKCCANPGCQAKLPDRCGYRHKKSMVEKERLERERRFEKEKRRLQEEINARYQQWNPPGRHVLDHVAEQDQVQFVLKNDEDESATEPQPIKSIDSLDKIVDKSRSYPITDRKQDVEKFRKFLDETCDLHKLPRFACCRLHDDDWTKMFFNQSRDKGRIYASAPLACICNSVESMSGNFYTAKTSFPKPHSVCSECHIRIGTQQSPPCTRYLLPLKAVRCYEEAIKKYGPAGSVTTDSGLSLDTARDIMDESDENSVSPYQQRALMDLLGLTQGPRSKLVKCKQLPANDCDCSDGVSSAPSSGVCCHVTKARQLPVMHLQGFGCESPHEYTLDPKFEPLPLEWWRRHDVALHSAQECVDACVRTRVLVAKNKADAVTEHGRTCKVCGPHSTISEELSSFLSDDVMDQVGGMVLGPRYSEMLPLVWKPTVREDGRKSEAEHSGIERRIRFYRQIIQATVESTRSMLLVPDLQPPSQTNRIGKVFDPAIHVVRIAHFRAMMSSLNDILGEVKNLKESNIVNSDDITQTVRAELNRSGEFTFNGKPQSKTNPVTPNLLDSYQEFMKEKLCGSVEDCREVLSPPWDLPVKEQQIAGQFLISFMADLGIRFKPHQDIPLNVSMESTICSFLEAAVFKATTQTSIQRAVEKATDAKRHLAFLTILTRLCASRLLRFSERVEASISNTRRVVKGCLAAVQEKVKEREFQLDWWEETEKQNTVNEDAELHQRISSLLRAGRDDSRSTLDDVIIGFERLRRQVREDLTCANGKLQAIGDLRDEEALALFDGKRRIEIRKVEPSYDAWTESEVVVKERNYQRRVDGVQGEQHDDKDSTNSTDRESSGDSSQSSRANDSTNNEKLQLKKKERKKLSENERKRQHYFVRENPSKDVNSDSESVKSAVIKKNPLSDSSNESSLSLSLPELSDDFDNIRPSAAPLHRLSEHDLRKPSDDESINHSYCDAMSTDAISYVTCASQADHEFVDKEKSKNLPKPEKHVSINDEVQFFPEQSSGTGRRNLLNFVRPQKTVQPSGAPKRAPYKRKGRRRFGSVFATEAEHIDTEDHTRTALRTDKGKGMLQEIFGLALTPQEMVEAYQKNVTSLINSQSGGSLPPWVADAAQGYLGLLCVAGTIFACYSAFFLALSDPVLMAAIPIAMFCFGLVLEPLKCLTIAWILFLWRRKPAFYNSPLYIKSNPFLLNRTSKLKSSYSKYRPTWPKEFSDIENPSVTEYEDALYRRYCENKSRSDCGRRRRRKLPALAESDVSIDLDLVTPYRELDEAARTVIDLPPVPEPVVEKKVIEPILPAGYARAGFRRHAFDAGSGARLGFRRDAVDAGGHRDETEPEPEPPKVPGRLRIVWCSNAIPEDGVPPPDDLNYSSGDTSYQTLNM